MLEVHPTQGEQAQDFPIKADGSIKHAESYELESIGVDPVASKALTRKLDRHLFPILAGLYVVSFLDRTNIGELGYADAFFSH
jgi:hypothetical protein